MRMIELISCVLAKMKEREREKERKSRVAYAQERTQKNEEF
jgi:hypothetical protein